MSKELEALESLRCAVSLGLGTQYEEMNNRCDTIETALKTLEMFRHHPDPILLMAVIEKYIMELDYTWEEYDEVFKFEPKEREIYCQEDYETLRKVFRKCELN